MPSSDRDEIRRYVSVIKRAAALIEAALEADGGLLEQMAGAPAAAAAAAAPAVPAPPPEPDEQAKFVAARKKHIQDLMAIDCWPEMVPAALAAAAPSDDDQRNRANSVLDMMLDRSVEGLNFLDYGCGDGWVAQAAPARGVAESVGYDPKASPRWTAAGGARFTAERAALPAAHFDVVWLYDVLDHCRDPLDVMAHVRSLLRRGGVVYARCHPWTAKHASHLFKLGLNKAYLHLFLKWGELAELAGQDPMFTREEKDPLKAYAWWFHDFEVRKQRLVREPVSEFFHVPAFKELLAAEQGVADIDAFLKLMEVSFADHVLAAKD